MKSRHDGDCWVYAVQICTCGFFHDLLPRMDDPLHAEHEEKIYQHQANLHRLNQPPPPRWWQWPRLWLWRFVHRKEIKEREARADAVRREWGLA